MREWMVVYEHKAAVNFLGTPSTSSANHFLDEDHGKDSDEDLPIPGLISLDLLPWYNNDNDVRLLKYKLWE